MRDTTVNSNRQDAFRSRVGNASSRCVTNEQCSWKDGLDHPEENQFCSVRVSFYSKMNPNVSNSIIKLSLEFHNVPMKLYGMIKLSNLFLLRRLTALIHSVR